MAGLETMLITSISNCFRTYMNYYHRYGCWAVPMGTVVIQNHRMFKMNTKYHNYVICTTNIYKGKMTKLKEVYMFI